MTFLDADLTVVGPGPITVTTAAPGGGTSNTLKINVTAPVPPCDRDEPNETIAQAKELPFDTIRVYAFCADPDADFITFTAQASSQYIIHVLNPGSSVDAQPAEGKPATVASQLPRTK